MWSEFVNLVSYTVKDSLILIRKLSLKFGQDSCMIDLMANPDWGLVEFSVNQAKMLFGFLADQWSNQERLAEMVIPR